MQTLSADRPLGQDTNLIFARATPPAVRFTNEWISILKHDIRRLENASRHDQVCCSTHISVCASHKAKQCFIHLYRGSTFNQMQGCDRFAWTCAGSVQHCAGTSDPARLLGERNLGAPPRIVPGQIPQLVRRPLRLHRQDTGEPLCMLGQRYSSYGRQTYMGLPNMSQIVWAYIMTPTPNGVGHLISPRWLEEMQCFSLSLCTDISLSMPQVS